MTVGLLLLHAFPLDDDMWAPQQAELSAEVAIVTPGLPGHGPAMAGDAITTMADAADQAEFALRGTGIDRVVVCGLSMGGYVALEFWKRHRDLVAGLILANTRAGADNEEARKRRNDLADRLNREGIGFLADAPPPLLSDRAPEELTERVRALIRRQNPQAVAAASRGMGQRSDFTADLGQIDVPTLVITSTGDTLIPADATKEMGAHIPNARIEVIEGAGHLSNLEAPDRFNALVREHLERCGALGQPQSSEDVHP
ncbi:MAG: alpha/beta fold hydrolase [Dehalococcoidia bacterium]|nr:alpha/beta fold hydrolase [Dehalococcoidia bacterium]